MTELAFLLLSSTSPAQRLGTTRRLHSGLATCERGVRVGGAGLCGRGREGAKAEKGDHLVESSVQVRKPATEGATARLQRAAPSGLSLKPLSFHEIQPESGSVIGGGSKAAGHRSSQREFDLHYGYQPIAAFTRVGAG